MYKLNGTNLSIFSYEPGWVTGSNGGTDRVFSGFLDLPARIGQTQYNWGDDNGVEPYVLESEMFFGGRSLILNGVIHASDRQVLLAKTDALRAFVDTFTDLVPLETQFGTYQVLVSSIGVDFIAQGTARVSINMREPKPVIAIAENDVILTPASLKTFGLTIMSFRGDRYSTPELKEQYFTAYGHEGYQITKREAGVLDFELFALGDDWGDFQEKVKGFGGLLAMHGLRTIHINNDKPRSFFVTEGMQVTRIISRGKIYGIINFKGIELTEDTE